MTPVESSWQQIFANVPTEVGEQKSLSPALAKQK
jgi:hypothetical protein